MKKVLIIGATGAMGTYLVPQLLKMGYAVDGVSLDDVLSNNKNLRYIKADCSNDETLKEILKNNYDCVIDFMVYKNPEVTFKTKMEMFLKNTKHYIYLSSYRIYSQAKELLTEQTPRLLDIAQPGKYFDSKENEYSLYKALGEDMLKNSSFKNYTIIRPSITYSKRRFQLVTLEMDLVVARMRKNKTVILPQGAMDIDATMTWAGDSARMIANLVLNEKAFCECYTIATAEHHTWREIANYYSEIGGLRYKTVDNETYVKLWSPDFMPYSTWQLEYDRLFNRRIDNSKILSVTGIKQSEFMPLKQGLKTELDNLPKDFVFYNNPANERMDNYLKQIGEI